MAVSKNTEKITNVIVSLGAAVVIFGAWQKILHKPLADLFLTIGLLTEAFIFVVYAYLSLKGYGLSDHSHAPAAPAGNPALASLDNMLQNAGINPTNLQSLSDNFTKLNATVENMGKMSDMTAATVDFSNKTKDAAQALGAMKDAYLGAAGSVSSLNEAAEGTKQFHTQVQSLTKNLGSLNTIYELELQDTNNHLKAMNAFYSNLVNASTTMQGSVEDAKKAHQEIAQLAKNLNSLNTVYGNMLSAMQGRG